MAFGYGGDSSSAERKERIKEKREENLRELYNLETKKAKNPPELSAIGINLPKKYVIASVHEELSLEQMRQNYISFLENEKEIYKIKEIAHPDKKAEELCKSLKSRLEKSVSLFWKNRKQFGAAEHLNPGYFYNNQWVLINNPEFAEKYKGITSFQLQEKRRENREACEDLCNKMRKYT